MTSASPQPRVAKLSRSLAGPARRTRYVRSKTPNTPTSSRRGSRVLIAILDTSQPHADRLAAEISIVNAICMGQGLGCVNVFPVSLADLEGTQMSLPRQLAQAIGKRAVSIPDC